MGVAAALAVVEDPLAHHGPLELLFTLDEERGLLGARHLDPGLIRSRALLNLDTEDDGVLTIGCAGSRDTQVTWTRTRSALPEGWGGWELSILGLRGGHSGTDIGLNPANAINILLRLIHAAAERVPLRLITIQGGSARNAIPRECRTVLAAPLDRAEAFREFIEEMQSELADQYVSREPGFKAVIVPSPVKPSTLSFSAGDTRTLLNVLRVTPSGVITMSQDPGVPNHVETSNNLATISTSGQRIVWTCCSRSSVPGALCDVVGVLQGIAELGGAMAQSDPVSGYPCWKPNYASPVLSAARRVYQKLFGHEPRVEVVHAGLECGVIRSKIPNLDPISFGPTIRGAHAPGERVNIASVDRFYRFLLALLDDLSQTTTHPLSSLL
jgi:dipeptidase D